MKKIMLFAMMAVAPVLMAKDVVVKTGELPAAAQSFLKEFFASDEVLVATKDSGFLSVEFEVFLKSGTKIEFDKEGTWKEVDGNGVAIPEKLLPPAVLKAVKDNLKGEVTGVELKGSAFEVRVGKELKVKVSAEGKILSVDD